MAQTYIRTFVGCDGGEGFFLAGKGVVDG